MGIDVTKPVDVYRNLARNVWSIRQNGKVECHAKKLILRDCTFHVSEAGRQRVLQNKRKNIHAVIRGYLSNVEDANLFYKEGVSRASVRYNPYQHTSFVSLSGQPIHMADWVDLMIDDVDDPVLCWGNVQ